MEKKKNVIIIGGGISGLSTAYHLQESARASGLPVSYTLIEGENRLGGKIITEQVDGFTVEGGPDCFLRQKPWASELSHKLGLGDDLMGTNDERRKLFVVNKRRLTPLPDGVMLIIPTRIAPFVTSTLISWSGKMRMGMDLLIPPRKSNGDESIANFVRRRLGEEALEKIAEPLLSGIHVSDPEDQSLLATFPRFRDLELKYGNLIFGMLAQMRAAQKATPTNPTPVAQNTPSSLFITLKNGLGQVINALENQLMDGQIVKGTKVVSVERTADGSYMVETQDGRKFVGCAVVLATPAYISADLLNGIAPELSTRLKTIRYVTTATISLGYARSELNHALHGFGFVVPRRERKEKHVVTACTWTSTKFNHRVAEENALIRCFVGGPGQEEVVERDDESLIRAVLHDLKELMGITAYPVFQRIYRWHKANPQYDVGHLDKVGEIQALCAQFSGLYVTGSAFEGVGVPDCVRQGKQTAQKLITDIGF